MDTRLEEGEEDNVLVRVVFFYFSNYISIRRGFSLLSIHNSSNLTNLLWALFSSYPSLVFLPKDPNQNCEDAK